MKKRSKKLIKIPATLSKNVPKDFLSETTKEGKLWEVVPIVSGLSANNVYYPPDVLKRHFDRIEFANSYLYQTDDAVFEHLPEEFYLTEGRDYIGNLVGWLEDPRVEEENNKVKILCNWYIHNAADSVRQFLMDCWSRGKKITLSITALVDTVKRNIKGKTVDYVNDIWFVSADPVSFPAVEGAEVTALLASQDIKKKEVIMNDKLQKMIFDIAEKIIPDHQLPTNNDFNDSSAVALLSRAMEALSPASFPEETLRNKLGRARKELENGNYDSAAEILKGITASLSENPDLSASEEVEEEKKENETDKVKSEAKPPQEGEPKTDRERLEAHFGEQADSLIDLLGEEAAYQCLPPRGTKLEQTPEKDEFMEKLQTVFSLLDNDEVESAMNLLSSILEGVYGVPYVYPEGSPYASPEEETMEDKKEEKEVEDMETETEEEEITEEKEQADTETEESKVDETEIDTETEDINTEDASARITKIELDKLLEESELPPPAQKRIREQFFGKSVPTSQLKSAIEAEAEYLSMFDINLKTEVKSETQKALEALQQELSSFKKEKNQVLESLKTQKELEKQLRNSHLTPVSESRIREKFKDRIANEDEIQNAIDEEHALAMNIISELSSTVSGFGDSDTKVAAESDPEGYIHDFFAGEMNVPKPSDNQ